MKYAIWHKTAFGWLWLEHRWWELHQAQWIIKAMRAHGHQCYMRTEAEEFALAE